MTIGQHHAGVDDRYVGGERATAAAGGDVNQAVVGPGCSELHTLDAGVGACAWDQDDGAGGIGEQYRAATVGGIYAPRQDVARDQQDGFAPRPHVRVGEDEGI